VEGINVLVATAIPHFCVKTIAESVDERPDMTLIYGRWVDLDEVDSIIDSFDRSMRFALIIVGQTRESSELAARWLADRKGLVVMYVDIVDEMVRFGLRDPNPVPLLNAVRELVESVDTESEERTARVKLSLVGSSSDEVDRQPEPTEVDASESQNDAPDQLPRDLFPPSAPAKEFPLLKASIEWVHALLERAVQEVPDDNGDVSGFSITRTTVLQSLDPLSARTHQDEFPEDAALDAEFETAGESDEPLAVAIRVFGLDQLEFRMMLLILAPELDIRFQRCIGFLMDDMGRRVGSMGLYCSLLGIDPQERGQRINDGSLERWLVFDRPAGNPAAADEPLRPDAFLAQWLVGDAYALDDDPRVRRGLRLTSWPGASVLVRQEENAIATELMHKLCDPNDDEWILLPGEDASMYRALIELGANCTNRNRLKPIRVDLARFANADTLEIEDFAQRVGRLARLTGGPLVVDLPHTEDGAAETDRWRVFFSALRTTRVKPAVICGGRASTARLLESVPYEFRDPYPFSMEARAEALRAAIARIGIFDSANTAEALAHQYPLQVDRLEYAISLAYGTSTSGLFADDSLLARLIDALKDFASEGISHLVDRIEPIFTLEQVILPADRKQQLYEIVNNVRFASHVLDDWKFRDQLPYGRGVAALFFGTSGTGKTMAAMGIARELGVQILRLDLSRVVSKYIGETEKNLDRVFTDAQRSGAAILIDEADALFGKRSEVRDAHDRYANIEVAFLLQRMEAYDGLAILTTNMRKNLDPAFTRRLRFIVDFPRPDIDAREKIWRQCLPEESHELTDGEFRQLARRIDFTGGQIRQTTLRAAFIAAAADRRITLEDVARATQAELAKNGMLPVELDLTRIRRAA
jgi:AAA+ superfamily predicted ATPase